MSTFAPRTGTDSRSDINFSLSSMGGSWDVFHPQYPLTPEGVGSDKSQDRRGSVEMKENSRTEGQQQDPLAKGLKSSPTVPVGVPIAAKTSLLGSVTDNLTRSYSRGSNRSKKAVTDVRNILQKLASQDKEKEKCNLISSAPSDVLETTSGNVRGRTTGEEIRTGREQRGLRSGLRDNDLSAVPIPVPVPACTSVSQSLSRNDLKLHSNSLPLSVSSSGSSSSRSSSGSGTGSGSGSGGSNRNGVQGKGTSKGRGKEDLDSEPILAVPFAFPAQKIIKGET